MTPDGIFANVQKNCADLALRSFSDYESIYSIGTRVNSSEWSPLLKYLIVDENL